MTLANLPSSRPQPAGTASGPALAPTSERPRLSVVVPTRNRPDHALACARALLAGGGFEEVVFVDQSDGPETGEALAGLGEPRVRHVRSATRGATSARNVGIGLSGGEVIAFIDDDCRAAPDWARRLLDLFASDPGVAVVCGRVHVPDDLRSQGFAMEFEPRVREWQHRFPPPDRDWGITANLSARRSVIERVGCFDPFLGPGAPLLCGEEPDFLFRVLKAGLKVVNAAEVQVEHLGVRKLGGPSRDLWRTYGVGTAAALFKHVRLGDAAAALLYLRHLAVMARVVTSNLVRGRRPTGIRYVLAFLEGARMSFRFGIDRKQRSYRSR
jgi:glycosyltransferase involved in cell wall biosynthesis